MKNLIKQEELPMIQSLKPVYIERTYYTDGGDCELYILRLATGRCGNPVALCVHYSPNHRCFNLEVVLISIMHECEYIEDIEANWMDDAIFEFDR